MNKRHFNILVVVFLLFIGITFYLMFCGSFYNKNVYLNEDIGKTIEIVDINTDTIDHNFGILFFNTECMTCYDELFKWKRYLEDNSHFIDKIYFLMDGGINDYWLQYTPDFEGMNIIHIKDVNNYGYYHSIYSRVLMIVNDRNQIEFIGNPFENKRNHKTIIKYLSYE